MSTELQLIILAIGLDSLVALHLLVIGVVMALMRKQPRYWRMFGAGLLLSAAPFAIYCGLDYPDSGSAVSLVGLLLSGVVMGYAVLVVVRGRLTPIG